MTARYRSPPAPGYPPGPAPRGGRPVSERTTPAEYPPTSASSGPEDLVSPGPEHGTTMDDPSGAEPTVVVARTGRGWSVFAPGRAEDVDDLVEGMTLADLVSAELGEIGRAPCRERV